MKTFGANTIAGKRIADMAAQGYTYRGYTTGQYSEKPNSNLGRKLASMKLTIAQVEVRTGAKMHRATEGTELLIFTKGE